MRYPRRRSDRSRARIRIWTSLAILTTMATLVGCADQASVEPVPVTGNTGPCIDMDTRWSGAPPTGSSIPGSTLERTVVCPDEQFSDDRLLGRSETVLRCEFETVEADTVGTCEAHTTITNEQGTWVGGEETLTITIPAGESYGLVHHAGAMSGTGDYAGLRWVYETGGTTYPWPVKGTIEPDG